MVLACHKEKIQKNKDLSPLFILPNSSPSVLTIISEVKVIVAWGDTSPLLTLLEIRNTFSSSSSSMKPVLNCNIDISHPVISLSLSLHQYPPNYAF